MNRKGFGAVVILALFIWSAYFVSLTKGQDTTGYPSTVEEWETLPPEDLVSAFDSLRASGDEPRQVILETIAKRMISLLRDATYVAQTDASYLLALADRVTAYLGIWYTESDREVVSSNLDSRLSGDSSALVTGDFDTLANERWEPALLAGVSRPVVADPAAAWADANDWRALSPERQARLARMLEDDLVDRLAYSVRWSGSIVPARSDQYVFSFRKRGGDVRIVLGGETILDSRDTLDPETPGDTDISERSAPQSLAAGVEVPLTVEYVFDAESPEAWGEEPVWLRPLFHGWSSLMVEWQGSADPEPVSIPESVLRPPAGFATGTEGLEREVYGGLAFEGAPLESLSRDLSLVLCGGAPGGGHRAKQEEIAATVVSTLLDPAFSSAPDQSPRFRALRHLGDYLTVSDTTRLLGDLVSNPSGMAAVPAGELYHFYRSFLHVDEGKLLDVVVAWCALDPAPETVLGVYPGWELERANYNHGNFGGYWHIAHYLGSEEELDRLRGALEEPDGGSNLRVARLGALAHKEAGRSSEWITALEAKLSDPALSGDTKVSWLIARAFAEELRGPGDPEILKGRAWLEQALGEAETEAVRLRALGELVARLASSGRADETNALLDSVAGQFGSAEATEKFAEWRGRAAELRSHYDDLTQKQVDDSLSLYIEELERRLAKASADGDPERVARYERLLTNVQAAQGQ